MSSVEGPLPMAATTASYEESPPKLVGDPDARSVAGSSVEGSRIAGVFDSPIYINLGGKASTPEEKLAAGYRLVEAQKKDIDKMSNRLLEINTQLNQKEQSIGQLYDMVEQVSPMLTKLSNWNEKLSAEEKKLTAELQLVKGQLGIAEADTDTSAHGEARGAPQQECSDRNPLSESPTESCDLEASQA